MALRSETFLLRSAGDLGFRALPQMPQLLWYDLLSRAVAGKSERVPLPGDAESAAVAVLMDLGWLLPSDDARHVRVSALGQG